MARVLAKHSVEQFVEAWLSKLRNDLNIRKHRKFIEKAIKQLRFFLNPPCCDDPEATVEYRRLDNDLTRFISAQLANKIDHRKWKKSLERAIEALDNKINNPCCFLSETIEGIIRVDAAGGVADISIVELDYNGLTAPVYVSGDPLVQTAGQSGVFTILNGIHVLTVYGDAAQVGLKWHVVDSEGNEFETPYVGGNSESFPGVIFNLSGSWLIEVIPV